MAKWLNVIMLGLGLHLGLIYPAFAQSSTDLSSSYTTDDADTLLKQAGELLAEGKPLPSTMQQQLLTYPDGQWLLARFYQFGSYGLPLKGEAAFGLYQQAAENGQMAAALYCWDRCIEKTELLGQAIADAAERGDPDGLYLRSQWLAAEGRLQAADQYLVQAARARQVDAMNELYLQHFLDWSANQTHFKDAETKLLKCNSEGLIVCQLLLGALYQRHNDADKAIYHYLQLVQLDYPLSRTYLYADEMDSLLQRMPADSLAILQSRVATALINHPAATDFTDYGRFQACRQQSTYACIRRVVKRDDACMVSTFANSYLAELRQSAAYIRCLNQP